MRRLVPMAARIANAATRQSTVSPTAWSPIRGRYTALLARNARAPARPSASPPSPPAADNSRHSIASRRNSWTRGAPRAVRTAISRRRASPLATRRLATFAHAMSSRIPTAATTSSSEDREPRTMTSCSASTLSADSGPSTPGNRLRNMAVTVWRAALAPDGVVFSSRRPATPRMAA